MDTLGSCLYIWLVGECDNNVMNLLRTNLNRFMLELINDSMETELVILEIPFKPIVKNAGYGVVRDLVGHGLGKSLQ